MKQRLDIDDIPELPGYLSVAAVSEMYGVNKGTVYHMIYESRRFKKIFKITKGAADSQRPMLLLPVRDVEAVFAEKERPKVDNPHLAADKKAWNRRVKDWAEQTGWSGVPIQVFGPPPKALVLDYLSANPNDPQPGS